MSARGARDHARGRRCRFEVTPGQFCEGQYVVVERPGRLVFTWGWTDPAFGLPPGSSRVGVTLTPEGASVQWETQPPLRTGSRVAFTARFLGGQLACSYEITEFVPAERLVMRTAQGPFPMQTTYTWQAVGDGSTRMTLRNRG